jgi:hypothetical protein
MAVRVICSCGFEHELIVPTDAWTRNAITGELEPFYRQRFYDAAIDLTTGQ